MKVVQVDSHEQKLLPISFCCLASNIIMSRKKVTVYKFLALIFVKGTLRICYCQLHRSHTVKCLVCLADSTDSVALLYIMILVSSVTIVLYCFQEMGFLIP